MKKKTSIIIAIFVLLLGGVFYFFYPFYFSGMYWACEDVKEGIPENIAQEIMGKYANEKYHYTLGEVAGSGRPWDMGADKIHTYISGNFTCSIFITGGTVTHLEKMTTFF